MFKHLRSAKSRNGSAKKRVNATIIIALLLTALLNILIVPSSAKALSLTDLLTGLLKPHEIIVQLAPGQNLEEINQQYNTYTLRQLDNDGTYLLSTGLLNQLLVLLNMDGDNRLLFKEPHYRMSVTAANRARIYGMDGGPLTPLNLLSILSRNQAKQQWAFDRISLNAAQTLSKGAGVTVAVIDTGVNQLHQELLGKVTSGYNFVARNPLALDDNGHGTFVAGLVALVAPNVKIMPIKALGNDATGDVADAIEAIHWAADHDADIINLSMGMYTYSKAFENAIKYAQNKGVVVVASAGNEATGQGRWPATYSGVISVAALDQNDKKAGFSNYGPNAWISAPGVKLVSAYYLGGYAYGDGTSFSSPLVAGEAALVKAYYPGILPEALMEKIARGSDRITDQNYLDQLGQGEADAYSGLTYSR